MKRTARISTILACLALVAACSGEKEEATQEAPSIDPSATNEPAAPPVDDSLREAVTRMSSIDRAYSAVFSPEADRVAYISSEAGIPSVWISDMSGENRLRVRSVRDQVTAVDWAPGSDWLAISVAPDGALNSQIFLTAPDDRNARQITPGGKSNNWLGGWSSNQKYVIYSSNVGNPNSMDCYLYDVTRGKSQLLSENNGIGRCDLSQDSKRALAWRMQNRGNTDVYLIDVASGTEQLLTPHSGVALSGQALFAGNDTVFMASNVDRERMALARIDIDASGMAGKMQFVAEREDAELSDIALLGTGKTLALLWNASGRSELEFFDLETGVTTPGPALPGEIARGLATSRFGSELAITVSGSTQPTNVWALKNPESDFVRVSNSAHDGVDLARLIEPELRSYTAHDGLQLSGWLYQPEGAEAGPMVLSFHGGPEGQERPAFRATYQALLDQGISVFAPNVRGSSGFGKTFVNLDNGKLRFDGVKDIVSTVMYVVDEGLADSRRIGIMGGSYGGYMVMAGLTEYPDLFAAGANLFGIVNFATFFEQTEPWMAAISKVEYGDPVADAELLEQLSPIHRINRIKAPTLVLHGANDTNVPVIEAEQVVSSLKKNGVPVKYVLFEDEGHGWRKTENRITSDVEIVNWFFQHL